MKRSVFVFLGFLSTVLGDTLLVYPYMDEGL